MLGEGKEETLGQTKNGRIASHLKTSDESVHTVIVDFKIPNNCLNFNTKFSCYPVVLKYSHMYFRIVSNTVQISFFSIQTHLFLKL